MNRNIVTAIGAASFLAACNSNTAPGNDKLAELEKEPTAAPQMAAGPAPQNVAGALYPGILTSADMKSLGGSQGRCIFRMTEVGFPAFVYGGTQPVGTIKLNGKLVIVPGTGTDTYSEAGLTVEMREQEGAEGEATMIVRAAGAPDELGFRGFSSCNS